MAIHSLEISSQKLSQSTGDSQPVPARGRPRNPERMLNVIAIASSQFSALGYERTSMDTIGKLSGVSKVTIYKYFPSKKKLFEACISNKVDTVFEFDSTQVFDPKVPRDALRYIALKFIALQNDEIATGCYRTLISMAESTDLELRELCSSFFELGPQRLLDQVACYLRAAHKVGSLNIDDASIAADEFLALFHDSNYLKILLGLGKSTTEEDNARIERNLKIFMSYYKHE
ncbi:MAG: TetR/AcrR family transcriptional regulator [Gammaproteobacteria bacterium]|nr:TetR/AcrR family transcriptional regulator [Gammaproteobacteria bacterium]